MSRYIPDEHPPEITPAHIKVLRRNKRNAAWLNKYEILVEFKNQFGRFPKAKEVWNGVNIGLFRHRVWYWYNKGKTKWYQFKLLDQIGFPFKRFHEPWDSNYDQLMKCWEKDPDSYPFIPDDYPNAEFLLRWIILQRERRSKGRLTAEQKQLLDKIEFPWDQKEAIWIRTYRILKKTPGWIPSSDSSDPEEYRISLWIRTQRQYKKNGKLSEEKIRSLDGIGFWWIAHDVKWEMQFEDLKTFVKKHNRLPQRQPDLRKEYLLCAWYTNQKKTARQGVLSADRLKRLVDAGLLE